ncbi:MAG: hypothetical protein MK110_10975 [Fuerstiella sp.]|nr:hypothetical protein [Fuerstiella sp.]
MTTIGKVFLWLTVIGLGVISVWLLPAVGKHHNDVSTKLVSSRDSLDKAITRHRDTQRELSEQQYQLAGVKIGWDKSWNIEQSAESGVEVDGGRLNVRGLGTNVGLIPVLDDAGQSVEPAVYAFKQMADGNMFYVGEFQVEQRRDIECTLLPNWQVTQEELNVWLTDPELPWRFRSLVPAPLRLQIDELHSQLQKLSEDYSEIQANVAQQTILLEQAKSQLEIRRQELLGHSDAQVIPGHPEYTDGRLKAVSVMEETRNDLLIQVDRLRREIRQAGELRDQLQRRLDDSNRQLATAQKDQLNPNGEAVGVAVSPKPR